MSISLLAGCPDRTVAEVPIEETAAETKELPAHPQRDIDILFLIDDSPSMKEEQDSLKANFGRFISVLESIDGGLPNVHIAVATPNLGTSAIDGTQARSTSGCAGTGEGGKFRRLPSGAAFISDIDDGSGSRVRNYAGSLSDAFAQIATVGSSGCIIEQHLEAVKKALDNNPANTGFLRPDAYLAVIIVADEDDCSLAKSSLFEGSNINFKCTKEAIECDSPSSSLDQPGLREDCHPKYDSTTMGSVDRYVDFLKSLKADPRDVIVAGIIGDAGPFEIVSRSGVPALKASCKYDGPTGDQYAYPALRTTDFLAQFPDRSTTATICDGDLSDGVTQVAALLKRTVSDPCFEHSLADVDSATAGAQYDCSVTDVRGDQEIGVVPACDATRSQLPCWHIEEDAQRCAYTKTDPHLKLVVERGGHVPGADVHVRASCVTDPF
jgi:hypothetical protein